MIELRCGSALARIDEGAGGRLASLIIRGIEVMGGSRPIDAEPAGWFSGSFPLAPWAGALPDGGFAFESSDYALPADEWGTHLHGLTHASAWTVDHADTTCASLSLDLPPAWPFGGHVEQHFALDGDGLTHSLVAANDERAMPVTLGLHPWFPREIGGEYAEVRFCPTTQYSLVDGIVTTSRLFGDRPWDAAFSGLTEQPRISWPGVPTLTLSSSWPVWVFYEQPARAFCIEPWTAPPGALGTAQGQVVSPGKPVRLEFRIGWDIPRPIDDP